MSYYERAYGTDWETVDKEEAVERAYALGVAESMGEYDREEFQRLYEAMDSTYDRSMVELAFEEGKNEGKEFRRQRDGETSRAVWESLVEGEKTTVDPDDVPTGGRDGLPETLDSLDALDRPDPNDNEAIDKPDFLEK